MVMINVPQADGILYRHDADPDEFEITWIEVTPEKHGLEWYDNDGTYTSEYRFAIPNEEDDDYEYTTLYSYESEMVKTLKRVTNVTEDKIDINKFVGSIPMAVSDVLYYVGVYAFKEALTPTNVDSVYTLTTQYLFDADLSGTITDLDCKIYTIDDQYVKTYYTIIDYDIQENWIKVDTTGLDKEETLYIDAYYCPKVYNKKLLDELVLYRTIYNITNEAIYGLSALQFDDHGWVINGESYTIGNITVTKANLMSLTLFYENVLREAKNNFELRLNKLRRVFITSHNTSQTWSEQFDRTKFDL